MKRIQPGSLRFHVSSNMDHMVISLAPALNVEPHNLIRDSLSMFKDELNDKIAKNTNCLDLISLFLPCVCLAL